MAKYLIQASYTLEGAKGVAKSGGSARRAAAEELVKSVGGKLEAFYFGFGKTDAYVLCDIPDTASAVALSMAVNTSGMVNLQTIPLITPEEVDMATKKNVFYRAPGK
jgi:uncharacterized protein with GYD domain